MALALATAPWAAAELVEVVGEGGTVYTSGDDLAAIPEYFSLGAETNWLQVTAVFDSERPPIAVTETTAVYEALYGYGTVNGTMVPLSGITLLVSLATADYPYAACHLSGTAAEGWTMWIDAYSEDANLVSSLAFPVDGLMEPDPNLYTRCDVGANGDAWDSYTDQTFLPVFRRIANPPPAEGVWHHVAIQPQYGRFTISYDATPSGTGLDAVVGLSRMPADAYTDLPVIVRFAPSGWIDARNGSAYQASHPLRYEEGVTYRVEMTVDLWAKHYSATVTPAGGAPAVIARDFGFRTEHARANELTSVNFYSLHGTLDVRDVRIPPPASSALFSAGTWENAELTQHDGRFTVDYVVIPSRTKLDAVTGLSSGAADWFSDLAVTVRFAPDGRIDARDGNRYRTATTLRYKAGVKYHVQLTVDLAAKRYSATVRPEGGTARKIAKNYRFRSEQAAVTTLDTFALFSSGGGGAEVSQLAAQ